MQLSTPSKFPCTFSTHRHGRLFQLLPLIVHKQKQFVGFNFTAGNAEKMFEMRILISFTCKPAPHASQVGDIMQGFVGFLSTSRASELREKSAFLPCTSAVFEKPLWHGRCVCCLSPTSVREVVSFHFHRALGSNLSSGSRPGSGRFTRRR